MRHLLLICTVACYASPSSSPSPTSPTRPIATRSYVGHRLGTGDPAALPAGLVSQHEVRYQEGPRLHVARHGSDLVVLLANATGVVIDQVDLPGRAVTADVASGCDHGDHDIVIGVVPQGAACNEERGSHALEQGWFVRDDKLVRAAGLTYCACDRQLWQWRDTRSVREVSEPTSTGNWFSGSNWVTPRQRVQERSALPAVLQPRLPAHGLYARGPGWEVVLDADREQLKVGSTLTPIKPDLVKKWALFAGDAWTDPDQPPASDDRELLVILDGDVAYVVAGTRIERPRAASALIDDLLRAAKLSR